MNSVVKRCLSVLLSLSLAVGLMPAVSSAAFADEQKTDPVPEVVVGENRTQTENSDVETPPVENELSKTDPEPPAQIPSDAGEVISGETPKDKTPEVSSTVPDEVYIPSDVSGEDISKVLSVFDDSGNMRSEASPSSVDGSGDSVQYFSGDTMFETAVAEAKAAYPDGSSSAILVGPGIAWIDALSAAGLSASKGPILFTWQDSLQEATQAALLDMGVSSVIIVGGTSAVSENVVANLKAVGISLEQRLAGVDCFETQAAIYEYGLGKGYWNKEMAIVATASNFGDALSVSPIAYAKKAPIFLVQNGELPISQKQNLAKAGAAGLFPSITIVGGTSAVSARAEGFIAGVTYSSGGSYQRLSGATQYETSVEIAKWATAKQGFTWDYAAFSTGNSPYDALAGSVLQGVTKSVLLLVNDTNPATIAAAEANKAAIFHIRFFGGTAAISSTLRSSIVFRLSSNLAHQAAGIGLNAMIDLEYAAVSKVQPPLNYSRNDIAVALTPNNVSSGEAAFYQYAVIDGGYSGKVTAADLNGYIAKYGSNGMLAGKGQAFIDAAKAYGTNEVYLLSHAILESGWGASTLARGWKFTDDVKDDKGNVIHKADGKTYYNFFGIGAYDGSALSGGRLTAYRQGWDTPEKAILGAAKWISQGDGNYFQGPWKQNTLYKMRWNFVQAASKGAVWKQYATDKEWARSIARVMSECYISVGLNQATSGLKFSIPQY